VTAGPTYEDIDAVRYVGNRSSGKMGYAVAAEAARRGARVVLVSGPSHLAPPPGVEVVPVRSAREMQTAVQQHAPDSDIVVMAAAVADYTPDRGPAAGKIGKTDAPLELRLVRTPDILAELGQSRGMADKPVLVGFAAESGDPVLRGRDKLLRKQVDFIVANDISRDDAGFEADANAVTIISKDGEEAVALAPKTEIAARILDRAEVRLKTQGSGLKA
jgi:phosphopantothenoylcysteine decarboxylase/phosphopantothenate--cysteine ligase